MPITRSTMDALNLVAYCLLCGCEGVEGVAVRCGGRGCEGVEGVD